MTNGVKAQARTVDAATGNGRHLRIAAVADLHCARTSRGKLAALFSRMAEDADVLLLGGDLTDYGLPEEAKILAHELKDVRRSQIIAVLGNHDFHSEKTQEVKEILIGAGIKVLDGDVVEVKGVGFTGVKGFMGGFDERMLQPWGEPAIKLIVRESMEEAMKLESALASLHTEQRIVLLHYSPVRATVIGESPEIVPFLGSSRLEEALHRHHVTAVFHGHSHYGAPEARTSKDVPVYNVALPLLARLNPGRPPFRILDLPVRAVDRGK
jgi:Icc-related predicted phosphoesterase